MGLALSGCSDGDDDTSASPSSSAPENMRCSEIEVGDPIDEEEGRVPRCALPDAESDTAIKTFDCADGRIHVMFTDEDGRSLEGFVGKNWQEADMDDASGRTRMQIDCGG